VLSQGRPRDAAVNFGIYIEVYSGIAWFSVFTAIATLSNEIIA